MREPMSDWNKEWAACADEAAAQAAERMLPAWFAQFLSYVCELPDRNSPDDEPEAIVATLEELRNCAINAIEQCAAPTPTVAADAAARPRATHFAAKYGDGTIEYSMAPDGFDPDWAEMHGGVEIVGLAEVADAPGAPQKVAGNAQEVAEPAAQPDGRADCGETLPGVFDNVDDLFAAMGVGEQPDERTPSPSDMAYWNDNRARILDAIENAGFRLMSNRNGFWLQTIVAESTQPDERAAFNEYAYAEIGRNLTRLENWRAPQMDETREDIARDSFNAGFRAASQGAKQS